MPPISNLQKLQQSLIRKATNGSVFLAPSSAATIDATTLFDSLTGDLASAGLPSTYSDMGFLSTAGAAFGRALSESNVTSWQSLTPTRSDTTADVTTLAVVAQETKMLNIGLYTGADLTALKSSALANGVVRVDKASTPTNRYWRVLAVSVDESDDGEIVIARYLPNALPTGFGNQTFAQGDVPVSYEVTFTGYIDSVVGTAESYLFGGAGWNAKLTQMGFIRSVTGATTSASAVITATTGKFAQKDVGQKITGTGIPAATTILSWQSATQVTLSAAATATGASVAFVIGG